MAGNAAARYSNNEVFDVVILHWVSQKQETVYAKEQGCFVV